MSEHEKKPTPAPPAAASQSAPDESHGTIASGTGDTSVAPDQPPAVPGSQSPMPVPTEFGRYRILRSLGQGAMGFVYLAEDTQLRRQVALKIPQLDVTAGSTRLERFYREARLAATLRHPNLCPVYDVGEFQGTHFISMAYIEGKSLDVLLESGKRQSERAAAGLIRKVALALEEAHSKGVIHRDLKPANIMIDKRGEPIVMDFGLARQMNSADQAQITHSGAIIGTPSYMSPEQVQGNTDDVQAASDIYGLGVILYQLLTGRLPFQGSMVSILAQIATQTPAPPSNFRDRLSPDIEAICLTAMAKRASDRFASMAEFAAALTQYLRKTTVLGDSARRSGAVKLRSLDSQAVGSDSGVIVEPAPAVAPSHVTLGACGNGMRARWGGLPRRVRVAVPCAAIIVLGVLIIIANEDRQAGIQAPDPSDPTGSSLARGQPGPNLTKSKANPPDGLAREDAQAEATGGNRFAPDFCEPVGGAGVWHSLADSDGDLIVGGAPCLSSDDRELVLWRPRRDAHTQPTFEAYRSTRRSVGHPFDPPVYLATVSFGGTNWFPVLGAKHARVCFRGSQDDKANRPEPLPGLPAFDEAVFAILSEDRRIAAYASPHAFDAMYRAVRRPDGLFDLEATNLCAGIAGVRRVFTPTAIADDGSIVFTLDVDGAVGLYSSRTAGQQNGYEAPEMLLDLSLPTGRTPYVAALSRDSRLLFSHNDWDELLVMRLPEDVRIKIMDVLRREPAAAHAAADGRSLTAYVSPAREESADATGPQSLEPAGSTAEELVAENTKEASQGPAARKAPRRARPGAADVFPVNSVWKGKMRQTFDDDTPAREWDFTVTVNERSKNACKATFFIGGDQPLVYEFDASIRQNAIEWNTIDAKIRKGAAGRHRYSGKISNGNRLELRFSGTSLEFKGTAGVGTAIRQEP